MNDPVTQKIIASAFAVYKALGFGFLEKVYENALAIELRKNGLEVEQQAPLSVFYEGQEVGHYFADLIVEKNIIVELKSMVALISEHEVQVVHYLTATGIDIGLLINFGKSGVEVKRKYRIYRSR